jgi:hypothetical protein
MDTRQDGGDRMDAKTQTKIRNAVKKIRADMENDPEIRKQVAQNHIRVLAERGGLSLPEIIAAHDMWCTGATRTCPQGLSMAG